MDYLKFFATQSFKKFNEGFIAIFSQYYTIILLTINLFYKLLEIIS